ncbi:MAG: M3 family metallopeptidase [Planctomycetota bacterium]
MIVSLALPLLVSAAQADSPIAAQVAAADAALERIVAVPADERTVANTLVAIDDTVARFFEDARMVGFMADVSTDPAERDRGRDAQRAMSNWFDGMSKNEDLFRALTELQGRLPKMSPEQQRFFDESVRDYRRAGLDLPEAQRARLDEIDEELTDLGSEFRKNIADDETVVLLTDEELAGVPEAFVASLPQVDELRIVGMKGASLAYVLGYCEVPTTRKKIGCAAGLRGGKANVRVLEDILRLRHERARLLGYETTADYVIETRMAQTPETVWSFYEDLKGKLRRKSELDFAEFEAAKREHTGDPEATLEATDIAFYSNWLKREKYAVDTTTLREYFPLASVREGMFGVCQDLFGITFTDITDEARAAGRPLWHEDVQLFRVTNAGSDEVLGEFYLDLHPREGKFSHAAQFPLRLRKEWGDGTVTLPIVALVCNFTKPTAEQPSLVSHSEVVTLFHEFGHCLHSILTEATIASFSGTNVSRDFVEAPSQMLENWAWQPDVLARFAKHYETGEALPDEIIRGMIAAKNLGSGMNTEAQVYLGMMDMRFHTDPDGEVDTTTVCEETYREARLFEPAPHLVRQAAFGHLVGYEAGYYGYLWSSVYAQDMWSRFAANPMSPETARTYRATVLAPGGSRDALEMVREFLGREPNADAFLEHLGLAAAAAAAEGGDRSGK